MPVLVDKSSKVLIQGITGVVGQSFVRRMQQAGSGPVAGVTPRKAGHTVEGVPVFGTVAEAHTATRANVSLVCVPALHVVDAVWEAAAAGIPLVSIYTEGVPIHDSMRLVSIAAAYGTRVIGPNSAGLVTPRQANVSDLNESILTPGPIGVVSKSGTLTYEVIDGLADQGLGVSTVVCIGGDKIVGTEYADVLELFADDQLTTAVVMVGEIGGSAEVAAADAWIRRGSVKPLIAYVAGHFAPTGKRFGHAGAISRTIADSATEKARALAEREIAVATDARDVGQLVSRSIAGHLA